MSKVVLIPKSREAVSATIDRLLGLLRKTHVIVEAWRHRAHRRAELKRLLRVSPHLIADIGLDYDDVLAECRKASWQA